MIDYENTESDYRLGACGDDNRCKIQSFRPTIKTIESGNKTISIRKLINYRFDERSSGNTSWQVRRVILIYS